MTKREREKTVRVKGKKRWNGEVVGEGGGGSKK